MIAYCRKCGRSKWVETRQAARTFRTASCLGDHRPTTFTEAQKIVNSCMSEALNSLKLFNRDQVLRQARDRERVS